MGIDDTARWVPLRQYLKLLRPRRQELAMAFRQIEEILGDGLPRPARKYAEWWANDAAHAQARAWLDAGWQVRQADPATERVIFEHASDTGG